MGNCIGGGGIIAAPLSQDFAIKATDGSGIEVSEVIGKRSLQQDSVFVGVVQNELARTNPEEFFLRQTAEAAESHSKCIAGTTLNSAIIRRVADDVEITTANLGDSRLALVIRHRNGVYESILLTEDHDFDVSRVRKYYEDHGGDVIRGRAEGDLNMGAAIGDYKLGPLMKRPDVLTFRLSQFLRFGEALTDISVSLINSCDGLWDLGGGNKMLCNRRVPLDESGVRMESVAMRGVPLERDGYTFHISAMKQNFDERELKKEDGNSYENFSEALSDVSLGPGASTDNISVIHIPLVEAGVIKISAENPVMTLVCDGHGGVGKPTADGKGKEVDPDSFDMEKPRENWDGGIVSASVAADFFHAAQIREIPGVEVQKEQKFLFNFLSKRKLADREGPSEAVAGGSGVTALPVIGGAGVAAGGAGKA